MTPDQQRKNFKEMQRAYCQSLSGDPERWKLEKGKVSMTYSETNRGYKDGYSLIWQGRGYLVDCAPEDLDNAWRGFRCCCEVQELLEKENVELLGFAPNPTSAAEMLPFVPIVRSLASPEAPTVILTHSMEETEATPQVLTGITPLQVAHAMATLHWNDWEKFHQQYDAPSPSLS